jgi:hypothetical protein
MDKLVLLSSCKKGRKHIMDLPHLSLDNIIPSARLKTYLHDTISSRFRTVNIRSVSKHAASSDIVVSFHFLVRRVESKRRELVFIIAGGLEWIH